MSKKFKRKYSNDIAELINSAGYKLNKNTIGLIPTEYIENSNDWEEIVEKDYEVLEYKSIQGIHCEKGQYLFDVVSQYGNPNEWFIYKIRRKSDGVEFKIGDKVYWNWAFAKNKYFTIKSFNIIEDKLRFNTVEESGQNFIFELISKEYNLQHYKEPILTTEDGYECTLDDRVFGVLPKGSWETRFGINAESGILVHNLYDTGGKRYSEYSPWLWFKTKENAEKYIYDNKPEFSRKQILDAIEYAKYAEFSKGIWVLALKIKVIN